MGKQGLCRRWWGFFNLTFILFIFGCAWPSVAARGLSLAVAGEGHSLAGVCSLLLWWLLLLWSTGFRCTGFHGCRFRALQSAGSVAVAHGPICSAARGIESNVRAGVFLTIDPPGKSEMVSIWNQGWPAGPGELSLLGQVDSSAPGKPGLSFFCWCPVGSVTWLIMNYVGGKAWPEKKGGNSWFGEQLTTFITFHSVAEF